jgi:hypothetical protein
MQLVLHWLQSSKLENAKTELRAMVFRESARVEKNAKEASTRSRVATEHNIEKSLRRSQGRL